MLDNVGNITTTIAAGIVGSVVSGMSREPSSVSCMHHERVTVPRKSPSLDTNIYFNFGGFFEVIRCLVALFTGEMTTL